MGALAPYFAAEILEPRKLLAGVTLITHGYQPLSSARPAWLDSMKDAIIARSGPDTAVYALRIARVSGVAQVTAFDRLSGPSPTGTGTSNAETVIMLDWANASGEFLSYTNTATIAQLVEPWLTNAIPSIGIAAPLAAVPIHLIGHSRGASVVSELARGLAQDGIWIDQMTTLDPHPTSPDPAVNVYNNVFFADNYYETNTLLTSGSSVTGAHNINLTNINPDHTGIHAYYYGTINTTATTDGDVSRPFPINPAWYAYAGTGPRSSVGFSWSRVDSAARPADGRLADSPRVAVAVTASGADQWDNVLIASDTTYVTQGGTVTVSAGFWDDNNDATVTVAFDFDSNPYNGYAGMGKTFATASTGETIGLEDLALDTSSIAPGTYNIYAKITNGTRTRYDYASVKATIVAAAPPTLSIGDASVVEGNSGTTNATFTVSLSKASSETVTVNWATANDTAGAGSDYTGGSGTLSFSSGQMSKTITVQVSGDTAAEGAETFKVNLSGASNATVSDAQAIGTISNDDQITLRIVGSASNDRIEIGVSGGMLTVIGAAIGNGNNQLSNIGAITVDAGAGNDQVIIGSGIALGIYVLGGAGKDSLWGGDGNDTLTGGGGHDSLDGGAGNDRLNGSYLNDTLWGGLGNDRLYGNDGNDYINGQAGVDRIWGGAGDDILNGGSSNDKLYGDAGNDLLYGGKQDDLLNGGDGNNTLYGQDGDDVFYARNDSPESLYGGLGADKAQIDTLRDLIQDVETLLT